MIRIVTLEREYGAGAACIAQAIAAELGFTVWDKEVTEAIAERVKCDVKTVERLENRTDPMYHGLLRAFMRGSFESRMPDRRLETLDSETLAQLFESVITGIADRGNCVIMGRGAPWFLRERTDAMHVFLHAPYGERLRRTLAQGKTVTEAEELLTTVDRDRAAFVKKYYGKDWPDRHLYHLMINTKVGDAVVVRMILDEIELLNIQSRPRVSGMKMA